VRIEILASEGREKWWEISVNNLRLRVLLSLTLAIHRQNPCTVTSAKKSVGRQPNKMKKIDEDSINNSPVHTLHRLRILELRFCHPRIDEFQ
jgi:hypothetical protein